MIEIQSFTFNGFQENTYVLFDQTKECIIIDPGCYEKSEQESLVNFIQTNQLKPIKLVNTHCHIDHVLGNKFVADIFIKPSRSINFITLNFVATRSGVEFSEIAGN